MEHGQEKTIKVRVANGTLVYLKPIKYCRVHEEIDLVVCRGREAWEARHGKCGTDEKPAAVGLELPKALRAAA